MNSAGFRSNSNRLLEIGREIELIALESIAAHQRFHAESASKLAEIASAIEACLENGKKLLICGNGGSAADAQHVAAEMVGRFQRDRAPWAAVALTTDSSILTAVANDYDFKEIFARQVTALARPGDLVVGISTSGTSANVVRALRQARQIGALSVGFTGIRGEALGQVCDLCYVAPASQTARIQELHILAWHAICEVLEKRLLE